MDADIEEDKILLVHLNIHAIDKNVMTLEHKSTQVIQIPFGDNSNDLYTSQLFHIPGKLILLLNTNLKIQYLIYSIQFKYNQSVLSLKMKN